MHKRCKRNFTHLAFIFDRNGKQCSVTTCSSLLALSSVPTRTHIIPLASVCLRLYRSLTADSQCSGSRKAPQCPSIRVAFLYRCTFTPELRHQSLSFLFLGRCRNRARPALPELLWSREHPAPRIPGTRGRAWRAGPGAVRGADGRTHGLAVLAGRGNFTHSQSIPRWKGPKDHRVQLFYGWPIQGLNPDFGVISTMV